MYNVYFNIVSWEKCELEIFLWESQFGKLSKLYNADASVVSLFLYVSFWSPEGCSASQQVRLQPISFLKTGRNGCAGWTVIFSSIRKSVMRIMSWPYTPHTHTNIKKKHISPKGRVHSLNENAEDGKEWCEPFIYTLIHTRAWVGMGVGDPGLKTPHFR